MEPRRTYIVVAYYDLGVVTEPVIAGTMLSSLSLKSQG